MNCCSLRFVCQKTVLRIIAVCCCVLSCVVFAQSADYPALNQRPNEGVNNLWFNLSDSDVLVVFVHGILSDSRSAWFYEGDDEAGNVYWPELVQSDPILGNPNIFLSGFYTEVRSGDYSIRDAANEIYDALTRTIEPASHPALAKHNILFVTHSTGGIAVRQMLVSHTDAFKSKSVGLLLYASPSGGAADATRLNWLIRSVGNGMAEQLGLKSSYLDNLDKSFKNVVDEKRIPRLVGLELIENHFVSRSFLWRSRKIVGEDTGGRYFSEPIKLHDTDHFSAVKPNNRRHPAHARLRGFFEKKFLKIATGGGLSAKSPDRICSIPPLIRKWQSHMEARRVDEGDLIEREIASLAAEAEFSAPMSDELRSILPRIPGCILSYKSRWSSDPQEKPCDIIGMARNLSRLSQCGSDSTNTDACQSIPISGYTFIGDSRMPIEVTTEGTCRSTCLEKQWCAAWAWKMETATSQPRACWLWDWRASVNPVHYPEYRSGKVVCRPERCEGGIPEFIDALQAGAVTIVHCLIGQHGQDPHKIIDFTEKQHPIHYAADRCQTETVKYLVNSHGTNPAIRNKWNTPLEISRAKCDQAGKKHPLTIYLERLEEAS